MGDLYHPTNLKLVFSPEKTEASCPSTFNIKDLRDQSDKGVGSYKNIQKPLAMHIGWAFMKTWMTIFPILNDQQMSNKVRVVCTNQLDIWENRSLWFQTTSLLFVGGRILTVLWGDDENLQEIYAIFVNCNEISQYKLLFLNQDFMGWHRYTYRCFLCLTGGNDPLLCPSQGGTKWPSFCKLQAVAAARQRRKRTNRRTQMIHKFAAQKIIATSRMTRFPKNR